MSINVRNILEELTENMREDFRESRIQYYEKLIEKARALEKEESVLIFQKRSYQLNNADKFILAIEYYPENDYRYTVNRNRRYKLDNEKAQKELNRRVDQEVRDAFECFIIKNTKKLQDVIKHRVIKTARIHANRNLEGSIWFEFEDGACFEVRNQIVWAVSKNGKLFWRFPTTFHNVTLKNNEKMKMVSETKMKKEF